MLIELIILITSLTILVFLYAGRMKSNNGETFLFSRAFLMNTDEKIFEIIKFIFKKNAQLSSFISSMMIKIPHAIVHWAHKISNKVSHQTSLWVEKVKTKNQDRNK